MDQIGSSRAIEITKMAMDGLMARQQAIAANTANVMTPNYQRKDVAFEDQLKDMIQNDDVKRNVKLQNSAALSYNPSSFDGMSQPPTLEQLALLKQNSFGAYKPQVVTDMSQADSETGNNVEIEKEMMNMAKAGTQYSIMAQLESKMFQGLHEVIRGGGN